MDNRLTDQDMGLIAAALALVFAAIFYADMFANGLAQAAPRDAAALAIFVIMRWLIARAFRRTSAAVTLTAADLDDDDDTTTLPLPPQRRR